MTLSGVLNFDIKMDYMFADGDAMERKHFLSNKRIPIFCSLTSLIDISEVYQTGSVQVNKK